MMAMIISVDIDIDCFSFFLIAQVQVEGERFLDYPVLNVVLNGIACEKTRVIDDGILANFYTQGHEQQNNKENKEKRKRKIKLTF
jgi:hypothetical protein